MFFFFAFLFNSYVDEADKDEAIIETKCFLLKSGNELEVKVGRERFHAPEILFTVCYASLLFGYCCCCCYSSRASIIVLLLLLIVFFYCPVSS